jgi:hypothetical protein
LLGLVFKFGLIIYQDYVEVRIDREAIAADQAKERSLSALKELTKEVTISREPLLAFVITKPDLAQFIDLVEAIGKQKGATTSVVSANELGGVSDKKEIVAGWRLELRLEGSFNQVWQGLKLLEALPVAKQITEVNLVRTSAPGTSPVYWAGGLTLELPTVK